MSTLDNILETRCQHCGVVELNMLTKRCGSNPAGPNHEFIIAPKRRSAFDLAKEAKLRQMDNEKVFESGAIRTNLDHVRYDLISPYALERLAKRYAFGAKKRGDRNWEKGIPDSELINHIEKHLVEYKKGDKSDDHMAAIAWNVFASLHFDEVKAAPQASPDSAPETSSSTDPL